MAAEQVPQTQIAEAKITWRIDMRKTVVAGNRYFVRVNLGGFRVSAVTGTKSLNTHVGPSRPTREEAEQDCWMLVQGMQMGGRDHVIEVLEQLRGKSLVETRESRGKGVSYDNKGMNLPMGVRFMKKRVGGKHYYAAVRVEGREVRVPGKDDADLAAGDYQRINAVRTQGYEAVQDVARELRKEAGMPESRWHCHYSFRQQKKLKALTNGSDDATSKKGTKAPTSVKSVKKVHKKSAAASFTKTSLLKKVVEVC